MNDEKNPNLPQEDSVFHESLTAPHVGEEIGVDESAVQSAGLIHPNDAELDQILDEAHAVSDKPVQSDQDSSVSTATGKLPKVVTDDTVSDLSFTAVFELSKEDIAPPIQDYVEPGKPEVEEKTIELPPLDEEAEEKPKLPKRRPKMKKGYGFLGIPHVLVTLVWLAITVLIGVSLGRVVWVCAAEVLAFGKPDQEYVITVADGDNIETVAVKLKNAGLIKYPELFKMYADLTDAQEDLSPGTFTLNSKYDYHALVNAMSYHSPARETVEVMIPEGYTCAQIFAYLEEKGVCTVAELEEYAANGELRDRWFLEGLQRGDKYCLEGYLFPDTYEFYTNDEPSRVLGKFLDTFDARFTDIMKNRIDPLNERMAAVLASRGYTEAEIESRKFTLHDIITIASMIEKETSDDAESYEISSVIYNRLTNPANYPFLNIDATIIYALGGNIDPETGKTKPLTSADLQIDSPYNTYTVKGLIPGPISNPGRNSINAALDPTETDFYYYVYNPNTSKHLFAKNEDEHEANKAYVKSLEEKQE